MKILIMILSLTLLLASCELDYIFESPVCCKANFRVKHEIKFAIIEEINCHADHEGYIGEIVDFEYCD